MPFLSEQGARDIRRIIKESLGRDTTPEDIATVWKYLVKVLELVWNIKRNQAAAKLKQPGLFDF